MRLLALLLLAVAAARCGEPAPPAKAQQTQSGAAAGPELTGEHLHLVLSVSEQGAVELASAAEVKGQPVVSGEVLGDYFVEVTRGDFTLAVQSLPDPFAAHSFGGPQAMHHGERLERATLSVKVPATGLGSADLDSLTITLWRMTAGPAIDTIEAAGLQAIAADGRLRAIARLAGPELAAAIRAKGEVIEP